MDYAAGPTSWAFGFLPDPATFPGAVAVGVTVAVIVGVGGWLLRRRRRSTGVVLGADGHPGAVDDLATGIRQAAMAVRRTLEDLSRGVYLEEPDGPLVEESQVLYAEASRTVDEAEARLPRVELSLGDRAASARAAVEHLRETLSHLRAYATQPGEGEGWRMEELDAAKGSFETAQNEEQRFLRSARR